MTITNKYKTDYERDPDAFSSLWSQLISGDRWSVVGVVKLRRRQVSEGQHE